MPKLNAPARHHNPTNPSNLTRSSTKPLVNCGNDRSIAINVIGRAATRRRCHHVVFQNRADALSAQSDSSSIHHSPAKTGELNRDPSSESLGSMNQGDDGIPARVSLIAQQSSNRTEFFRNLAAELSEQFQCGLVAIDASTWANPMMLVTDNELTQRIERAQITELLRSASRSPIACDIEHFVGNEAARGLRIELTEAPNRSTLLLVYPNQGSPEPIQQVADLQLLNRFAESTRQIIETLGVSELERQTAEASGTTNTSLIQPSAPNGDARALSSFHQDLDLAGTAYRIANESRRLLDCDRATVLVPHGRGIRGQSYRVAAVSGVSVVDRRANAITAIERMANSAAVLARPLVLPGEQPLPPQIQLPLDEYLDGSGVMTAIMLPMHAPLSTADDDVDDLLDRGPFDSDGDVVGIMMLEYFRGDAPVAVTQSMSTVASEARLALGNALEHRSIFGLKVWKAIGSVTSPSRAPYVAAAMVLAFGLLALSMLVRIEHQVIVTGHIAPSITRQVFTPLDGIVKELMVEDGREVEAGSPLARLENAELESQAESLTGEIQTAQMRLSALASMRLSNTGEDSSSDRLAMEERQLLTEVKALQSQQSILKIQQEKLVIRAPIDGTVAGWQLERRLLDRPVSRGNALMRIVDPTSPWHLQLGLPDDDAGPVLEAAKAQSLHVEFAVATLPNQTFAARLDTIATAARMDPTGEHIIDVSARVVDSNEAPIFDQFEPDAMRSGADVTAKISCGQRSILRSWFGDVFDFVHRNILFYF